MHGLSRLTAHLDSLWATQHLALPVHDKGRLGKEGAFSHRPGLAENLQLRTALADQDARQVSPVNVQLLERDPLLLEIALDPFCDACLRSVGRCDADRDYQFRVEIAHHVAFVAVHTHAAALASVTHLGVFQADPTVFGHTFCERRRSGLIGRHILFEHLLRRFQAVRHDRFFRDQFRMGRQPLLDSLQRPDHLPQGLLARGRVVPVEVKRRLKTRSGDQLRIRLAALLPRGRTPARARRTPRALRRACSNKL